MKIVLSVTASAVLLLAGGCGESDTSEGVIGVSVLTTQNPFFLELAGAIEEVAKKHNFKVIVTSGERDPARQKDQIDDFIVKQVDAIVLCPCDSKAMGTSIAEANKEGIPVFTADIDTDIKIVSFDAQPEGREAVKKGEFYVTIVQYPKRIGRTVAETVFKYLDGEEVEPEILIPCTIYRKADADKDPTLAEKKE